MHTQTRSTLSVTGLIWGGWLFFFGLILAAWAALFVMAAGHGNASDLGPGAQWIAPTLATLSTGSTSHALHLHSLHGNFPLLMGMWGLMCVAMMAPTAVPLLRTYGQLSQSNPTRIPSFGFWALVAGYVSVWCAYSVVAATAQWRLAESGILSSAGVSTSAWLTVGLLAAAGAYQFSSLKQACLSQCRSPMAFLLAHWREGVPGAFRMGLRHGALCVGCCWALMALSFLGGTMNLLWMGAAMVLMIIEKVSLGRWLTAPLGWALLAAAGLAAARALVVS